MSQFFGREIAAGWNKYRHSLGALVGIAQGLMCDRDLTDSEIFFLHDWLKNNDPISGRWPGDILLARVKEILSDRVVTKEERAHLVQMLLSLVGGAPEELPKAAHATELAYDSVVKFIFESKRFCFTGDFVYGPRKSCEHAVQKRRGSVSLRVTKTLDYVVVGSLGSEEWKHGSFGIKIDQAMVYKRQGCRIVIAREEDWTRALA